MFLEAEKCKLAVEIIDLINRVPRPRKIPVLIIF